MYIQIVVDMLRRVVCITVKLKHSQWLISHVYAFIMPQTRFVLVWSKTICKSKHFNAVHFLQFHDLKHSVSLELLYSNMRCFNEVRYSFK